jgi:hypothetical protein
MNDPLLALTDLLRAVGSSGYVVVGGLAVRLLVSENTVRVTGDVDIVAMDEAARERLLSHLRSIGYHVGASGGWYRAALKGKPIIDVGTHPVVNPRTFEELTLRAAPAVQMLGGLAVSVASPDDLGLLKLVAHRDQDIVDLLLLSSRMSASSVAARVQHDDVERTAAEGAQVARLLIQSGRLEELTEELVGRRPMDKEVEALRTLLIELQKEGL